jgi:hypothetical protein
VGRLRARREHVGTAAALESTADSRAPARGRCVIGGEATTQEGVGGEDCDQDGGAAGAWHRSAPDSRQQDEEGETQRATNDPDASRPVIIIIIIIIVIYFTFPVRSDLPLARRHHSQLRAVPA